jgi:hypothetical protein
MFLKTLKQAFRKKSPHSRKEHEKTTRFRPHMESLERRELMAGLTATWTNGTLTVVGTTGDDTVVVRQVNGLMSVANTVVRANGGAYQSVAAGLVRNIQIFTGAGNDRIYLNSERLGGQPIFAPALIYAGDGNDIVFGGAGNDRIFGGNGNDFLVGGYGHDVIFGEAGNDVLIGDNYWDGRLINTQWDGNDQLIGGAGVDQFYGQGGFDWYHDDWNPNAPIINGASVTDVSQKDLGSCQTLAALTALVRSGYNVSRNLTNLGNGNFRVTLTYQGRSIAVNVNYNGWWNDNDPKVTSTPHGGYTSSEYWPILFQRARMQLYGVNWRGPISEEQMMQLHQQSGGRLASLHHALEEISGRTASVAATNQVQPGTLQTLVARGHAIVAGTHNWLNERQTGVVPSHAYAVMNVFQHNGHWYIQLHNPWGIDSSFGARGAGQNDGFITLHWNEFRSYFFAVAAV